jgi:phosphomevalonate kinase
MFNVPMIFFNHHIELWAELSSQVFHHHPSWRAQINGQIGVVQATGFMYPVASAGYGSLFARRFENLVNNVQPPPHFASQELY